MLLRTCRARRILGEISGFRRDLVRRLGQDAGDDDSPWRRDRSRCGASASGGALLPGLGDDQVQGFQGDSLWYGSCGELSRKSGVREQFKLRVWRASMDTVNYRTQSGTRPLRWLPRAVGLGLLVVSTTWSGPVAADDAPPPPPVAAPLDVLFQPVREMIKPLPPFLADTDIKVHFRTYYFNRTKPDDTVNEAWAFGGWITYQSGWLLDTFSMGASLYGSASSTGRRIGTARCFSSPARRATTSRRGVGRAALPGLRTAQGVPPARGPDVHQLPGQPDDAEHLPGRHARGQGGLAGVPGRLPLEDQAAQRRRVHQHVGAGRGWRRTATTAWASSASG